MCAQFLRCTSLFKGLYPAAEKVGPISIPLDSLGYHFYLLPILNLHPLPGFYLSSQIQYQSGTVYLSQ